MTTSVVDPKDNATETNVTVEDTSNLSSQSNLGTDQQLTDSDIVTKQDPHDLDNSAKLEPPAPDNPEANSSNGSDPEGNSGAEEHDRREEVPALLERGTLPDDEDEQDLGDQGFGTAADFDAIPSNEDRSNSDFSEIKSPPANHRIENHPKPEKAEAENARDLAEIHKSLQDSLTQTQYISSKIDVVSSDTECLIQQVNNISTKYEILVEMLESNPSAASSKNTLLNTSLIILSAVLVLLVISQIYIATSLIKTQKIQHAESSTILGNMSSLNKKIAVINHAKSLVNSLQQEQVPPHAVATEISGHEPPPNAGVNTTHDITVLEKLNKLRNGLPEKQLIRKETGDWFVYSKKSIECLSDIDVIEALNQAYKKSGRPLSTSIPLPAHNTLCILKPDGKGGTEIIITQNSVQ